MTTVDKLYGMASMNSFNDDFESSDDDDLDEFSIPAFSY